MWHRLLLPKAFGTVQSSAFIGTEFSSLPAGKGRFILSFVEACPTESFRRESLTCAFKILINY